MTGEVVRVLHDRPRVVAAFRLSPRVVERLEDLVGGGCRIVDIREADGRERLVLSPSASPQLLSKLHAAFPDATLLVVELTDSEHDVRLGGPVTRALDAGADGYLVARSLEELAAVLQKPTAGEAVIATQRELSTASEQELLIQLDDLISRRDRTASAPKID